jgi:hypothetical protein
MPAREEAMPNSVYRAEVVSLDLHLEKGKTAGGASRADPSPRLLWTRQGYRSPMQLA